MPFPLPSLYLGERSEPTCPTCGRGVSLLRVERRDGVKVRTWACGPCKSELSWDDS